MNRLKLISSLSLTIFILAAAGSLIAQNEQRPPIEPSYDVILQVIVGGDANIKGQPLPPNLSGVARQLKANYNFGEVRLANTYVGRVANGGAFEFKSVTNLFGRGAESDIPSFLEWSLSGLRSGQNAAGKAEVMIQNFRFGARIPVRTGPAGDAKQPAIVNYESIGLNSARVTMAENTPTLLGSLSLPGGDNAMFLVLTIRPA